MTIGLFFILLAALLVVAFPIGGVFGLMSLLPSLMDPSFSFAGADVARAMFAGMNSFTLLAVPMFMVSGMIMAEGGISEKLFNFFAYFIGNKTAGFPCAVVVTCMFYAAISGSSPATVSAVGAMTIPFLVEMGYDLVFATSIVTVAGGLGVIIPPSISYIVYSAAASASPSKLFSAGIIPGCLIGFALMAYCYYYCKKHGEDKAKLNANYSKIRQKGFWPLFRESFFALMTPVIILGTIYSGVCSPTESAVISVFYGLFVCLFIYKSMKITDLPSVFMKGAKTYVNILFVIAAASAFAKCLTMLRFPQTISASVLGISDNKIIILLVMNLIMLVCGMIIDNIPNIMILTPIMVPIAVALGVDPVHFGIIMTCNLAIGMVTPPMGINLFVASGMTKIPMLKLAKACMPFLAAFLASLLLITYVPPISMFLPTITAGDTAASSGSSLTVGASGGTEDYGADIEALNPADIPEEYHWTAAMTVADTSINYMMVDEFAKLINEKSGGKISVDIYPGGQLGNTTEFTEAVIGGSIDIGTGMTTDIVDFIPQYGVFDMPNLFKNTAQMRAVLNSDFVDYMNTFCNDGGIQMLGYSDAGFRQLTTNKEVHSIDDLKGQKIRVMTNKYHIAYWNALGAAATPMQFTEVFMGLQQGTIDGQENPYMNIVGNNVQEVQKYIVETNHIGHIITFFMNAKLYNSLPDNVRKLVDDCAKAATEYGNDKADESIAQYKQVCEDAGCEIITLDEETTAAIRDKAQVVYDMVREDLGDEIVERLFTSIEANQNAVSIGDLEASVTAVDPADIPTEYRWTAAMTVADTSVNYMMVDEFAKLINEKSGGKISVDIYPGGQLGNTTEFTEAVIGGSIDIGTGMTTDIVDFIPQYGVFDMPNLFKNTAQMRAVLNSDFVDYMNTFCNDGGIQMLGYSDAGFRQLTTNKEVHSIDDLKGQKIRVMTNKYHIAYWNALGAAATPMQFTEVFMGLQQGTIDGQENPYMNIVGNNVQEVQKYIVETNHIGHIITFFMNAQLYNSLPDNVRTLVDECAAVATAYGNSKADESIAQYKQVCEDAGCEIITLDEDTTAAIRDKAQVVYDMVRKDLGDEIVDRLFAQIEESN